MYNHSENWYELNEDLIQYQGNCKYLERVNESLRLEKDDLVEQNHALRDELLECRAWVDELKAIFNFNGLDTHATRLEFRECVQKFIQSGGEQADPPKTMYEYSRIIAELKEDMTKLQNEYEEALQENGRLKELISKLRDDSVLLRLTTKTEQDKRAAYERALSDLKPVIELYANSRVGIAQTDGTYKAYLRDDDANGGASILHFDPRPAINGLEMLKGVMNA